MTLASAGGDIGIRRSVPSISHALTPIAQLRYRQNGWTECGARWISYYHHKLIFRRVITSKPAIKLIDSYHPQKMFSQFFRKNIRLLIIGKLLVKLRQLEATHRYVSSQILRQTIALCDDLIDKH